MTEQRSAGFGLLGMDAALGAPLLDALPDFVLAFDDARSTRPIVWANKATVQAIGRDPEGEPLGAVLGGSAADVIDAATRLHVGEATATASTVTIAGRPLALEVRLVRVTEDAVVWIARDRTSEHEADRRRSDRLTARNDELQRSNFDLDQFAFVASHDLVEPLRMVTAYLDLISELYGDRLDDKGHQYLGFAVDGAQRMRMLIDDLLALARVNGSKAIARNSVGLSDVLAESRATLALTLAEADAELSVPDGLPAVLGDRGQLVQLFVNVLANAVKFNDAAAGAPRIRVEVETVGEGEQAAVRVAVIDEGIGIAPDKRAEVFNMFRRLHPRSRFGGSGMGLAICKAIVERHGGDIGIDAAIGGGTVVWFTLPLAAPPQPAAKGETP